MKNCSGNGCIIGNVNRIQNNGKPLAGFLPLRPTRFSTRSIRRTAAIVTLLFTHGRRTLIRSSYPGNYDRNSPKTEYNLFIVDHIQIPQLTGTVTTDQIADSLPPCSHSKTYLHNWKTISTDKYKSQETKILPIVIASKALETDFSPVLIVRNTKTEPVKSPKGLTEMAFGHGRR